MKTKFISFPLAALCTAGFIVSCGGGGSSPNSTPINPATQSTELQGVYTGANYQNGTLKIIVSTGALGNTQGTVNATGILKIGGGTQSLAGSYNGATGALQLSGGGYVISGRYQMAWGAFDGSISESNGSYSGGIATFNITGSNYTVKAYGGYASGPQPYPPMLALITNSNGTVRGILGDVFSQNLAFVQGTIGANGSVSFTNTNGGNTCSGSGTISANSINGSGVFFGSNYTFYIEEKSF